MNALTAAICRPSSRRRTGPRTALATLAVIAAVAIAGCQSGSSLAGPTWQWKADQQVNAAGQSVTVDPARYTIRFLTDGTLDVRADCNSLTGTYSIGIPLDLKVAVSTSNVSACGDASAGQVFLDQLARVETYSTDGGELKLFYADDLGGMRFAPRGG